MTEPAIILSDAPHEVVMPEGSHDARSKSGHAGGPSKHLTVEPTETGPATELQPEHRVLIAEPPAAEKLKDTTLKSASDPLPAKRPPAPPEEKLAKAAAPVLTAVEPTQEEMPEMDFPARIINIKIENDRVRSELDNLELILQKPH